MQTPLTSYRAIVRVAPPTDLNQVESREIIGLKARSMSEAIRLAQAVSARHVVAVYRQQRGWAQ